MYWKMYIRIMKKGETGRIFLRRVEGGTIRDLALCAIILRATKQFRWEELATLRKGKRKLLFELHAEVDVKFKITPLLKKLNGVSLHFDVCVKHRAKLQYSACTECVGSKILRFWF
jgi:hypothetical protein